MAALRSFDLGTLCGRNGWAAYPAVRWQSQPVFVATQHKDLTRQIVNPVAGRVFL
jgi:hypothetical protein